MTPALGSPLSDGLFPLLIKECKEKNPFLLYGVLTIASQFTQTFRSKQISPTLKPHQTLLNKLNAQDDHTSHFYVSAFEALTELAQ